MAKRNVEKASSTDQRPQVKKSPNQLNAILETIERQASQLQEKKHSSS